MSASTLSQTNVLIDTNIVSAHFKGDSAVTPKLQQTDTIYLPSIVLGELHFGAHRSPNPVRNLDRVERFAAAAVLSGLPITLVFLLAQRWIVSGLTAGGVKG